MAKIYDSILDTIGGTPLVRINRLYTGANEILYGFTVTDDDIYTQPWRGEMTLRATEGPIYEYACHEGNYALPNILAGAREKEGE